MKNELAQLLALCAATYNRNQWLKLEPIEQTRRCQQLASYNVLSVQALAAIFDVPSSKVEAMLGHKVNLRGTLNPKHISILAYALSNHAIHEDTLAAIIKGGTSQATIARLTLISRQTLNRRLK